MPGVREQIEIDQSRDLRPVDDVVDEVRADEAGAPCDEQVHGFSRGATFELVYNEMAGGIKAGLRSDARRERIPVFGNCREAQPPGGTAERGERGADLQLVRHFDPARRRALRRLVDRPVVATHNSPMELVYPRSP